VVLSFLQKEVLIWVSYTLTYVQYHCLQSFFSYAFTARWSKVTGKIRALRWKHPHGIELYLERPGTIYVIVGADENVAAEIGELLTSQTGDELKFYEDMGVRFEPLTCLIHCPEDLKNIHDIISRSMTSVRAGFIRRKPWRALWIRNMA